MMDAGERQSAPVPAPAPPVEAAPQAMPAQAVPIQSAILQAKLSVGPVGDRFEREADAVADRVVRSMSGAAMPAPGVAADRGIQRVRRSATIGAAGGDVDADTDRAIRARRGGGSAMPDQARQSMESAFGADFGNIRVHEGSASRDLNDRIQAKAFTVGNDVFFRDGMPDVSTSSGQHLLAHELTHTIQQGAAPVSRVHRSAMPSISRDDGAGTVRRLAYNQNPTTWGDPAAINRRRSGEGAVGVFFANDVGAVFAPGTVVIKPLASSGEIDFANKFLSEGMGFEVPDTVTYKLDSDEGRALSDVLSAPGLVGARDDNEVAGQLAASDRVMVMSIVEGQSIQTLDDAGATEFLMNSPALEQVGRLMVSDAFLGNGDRLVGLGPVNLGNFFYAAATAAAPGKITTIDNDSSSEAHVRSRAGALNGPLQSKVFFINQMASADGQTMFINKFLARMRQSHAAHANVIDALDNHTPRISGDIRDGIEAGLADIADVFTNNMDLVRSMTDLSDERSARKLKVDEAKGAAEYIKARQGGDDADTAAEKLSTYMTYRQQRNNFPKGLKWMTKVMPRGFTDDDD